MSEIVKRPQPIGRPSPIEETMYQTEVAEHEHSVAVVLYEAVVEAESIERKGGEFSAIAYQLTVQQILNNALHAVAASGWRKEP